VDRPVQNPDNESSPQLETVACDLCGGTQYSHLFMAKDYIYGIDGEWPVAQCTTCDAVLLNPRIPVEAIVTLYPKDYYTHSELRDVHKNTWRRSVKDTVIQRCFGYTNLSTKPPLFQCIVGWLMLPFTSRWSVSVKYPHSVPAGRLLEVGCGNGQMLEEYRRLGWETHGVEIVPDSAQIAWRADHQIVVGQLSDAAYENEYFDAVVLWDTLEHIHNPGQTVRRIHQITKPGGHVYISVPNYASWYARKFGDKWYMFTAPLHYYHYTQATLTRLLQQSGFDPIQISFPLGDAGVYEAVKAACAEKGVAKRLLRTSLVRLLFSLVDLLAPRGHLLVVATRQ